MAVRPENAGLTRRWRVQASRAGDRLLLRRSFYWDIYALSGYIIRGRGSTGPGAVAEALENGREGGCVIGREVRRLVEADVAVGISEDAVEDHEVEVEVGVEGGAEAVEEGDGAELGVGPGARAAAPEGPAGGP